MAQDLKNTQHLGPFFKKSISFNEMHIFGRRTESDFVERSICLGEYQALLAY